MAALFILAGAALTGIGVYGLIAQRHLLRQILAFNVLGGGLFLIFGALGRDLARGLTDPAPQAMIITGIVVALAATALAVTLAVRADQLRRAEEEDGALTPPPEAADG